MGSEIEQMSFEEALRALETTAVKLEAGDLSLEASLMLYEYGQKLADYCTRQLSQAQLRVEQLTADGEIVQVTAV